MHIISRRSATRGSTPVRLDVTSSRDVATAAKACSDVEILINNAGVMLAAPVLSENSEDALRREMKEVNVFGMLAVAKALAPALGHNGGGVIVNVLSVVSWYVYPFNATYCATKHAALAVTDGLRIQLKAQGTHVIGVYAGFIDTDMGAALSSSPKTSPQQVARKTVQGIRAGLDHVLADREPESTWQAVRQDPAKLRAQMQARWDQHTASMTTKV